jgi:signal transduction histidine kinase
MASPVVFIDVVEVARAIICLIENAISFTPEGGSIKVSTTFPDRHVIIAIEDTGIGIAANDLPRIFERFFRADAARSTGTGGHGLGLAIAKRIIDAHNGIITVRSRPCEGSTFLIQLPTST